MFQRPNLRLAFSEQSSVFVQVEVELEPTAEGGLSFCGVYLRYGNDIYTYSYCGGVFISGLIFGNGYYLQASINVSKEVFILVEVTKRAASTFSVF